MTKLVTALVKTISLGQMVTLVPLAMTTPNTEGIYCLSRHGMVKIISKNEFDTYESITIKLARHNSIDNWRYVTAYYKGLSNYYIAG